MAFSASFSSSSSSVHFHAGLSTSMLQKDWGPITSPSSSAHHRNAHHWNTKPWPSLQTPRNPPSPRLFNLVQTPPWTLLSGEHHDTPSAWIIFTRNRLWKVHFTAADTCKEHLWYFGWFWTTLYCFVCQHLLFWGGHLLDIYLLMALLKTHDKDLKNSEPPLYFSSPPPLLWIHLRFISNNNRDLCWMTDCARS